MIKICARAVRMAAVLLLSVPFHPVAAANDEVDASNTYYVKGTTGQISLKRRMALVGHNCMVSRLAGGVEVGSGSIGLSNLCDDDLTNHFTMPSTLSATLAVGSPIVAVKDMKHYFSRQTKAGFKISGQSDVLKLSVLQSNYNISFYKDGTLVGTSGIEQLGFTVLDLNVGDINMGSDAVDVVASDQPSDDYDEVALVSASGIQVSLVKGLEVYYAFVGDAEYSLTDTRIKDYDADMTVEGKSTDLLSKNLCDDNLSNEAVISAGLQLGSSGSATVTATCGSAPDHEAFPKGTEIGFVYNTMGVVNVAPTPTIFLYDKDGNKVCEKAVSSTVLGVNLSGGDKKVSITAPCDFSAAKMMVFGVSLISGVGVKYAFIVPEPVSAGHQCEMSPAASLQLCNCDSRYQLRWNSHDYPAATWSMVSATDGNIVFDSTDNTLDFSSTEAYTEDGTSTEAVSVLMRLTNPADGCSQDITVHYGGGDDLAQATHEETALVNATGAEAQYELGDGTSAGVSILSILHNPLNVLSQKLNACASYFGGVSIGDSYLCGVRKKSGSISDGSKAVQTGFVVTVKGSGLSADVLKLMNVRIFNDGAEVGGGVATAAVSARLIGSADTHKLRYSISVPQGTEFDEVRLYSTGLLAANLSVLNIYYAYTADRDAVLDDPMQGATVLSFDNTGASIDLDKTKSVGLANVGNGLTNLPACIDGSMDTRTLFPIGVDVAAGTTLAVKLGVTASRNQQLVIVVNKEAAGLGVKLADAMVVKTYKSGSDEPVQTFDDWSVLGANVITLGDHGYVFLSPKGDYDEVTITEGSGVSALSALGVYGIMLRNDKDGDGTPDADEVADECKQDLVFQETVNPVSKDTKSYKQNLTMYFQRTFVGGQWNSLILPVSLTKAQFAGAFGTAARLAEAGKLYQVEDAENNTVNHVVGFELVNAENDDDVLLEANKPYIIWLAKDFVDGKKSSTATYETLDAGTLSGEVYVVDGDLQAGGVNFDKTAMKAGDYEFADPIMTEWKLTALDFVGSYAPHQLVEPDSYIFNNGTMYHLNQQHWMKGFRCWLVPQRSDAEGSSVKAITFGIGGDATGIRQPGIDNAGPATGRIYNLAGQRVDPMTGIRPGVYIRNGKKIVVR